MEIHQFRGLGCFVWCEINYGMAWGISDPKYLISAELDFVWPLNQQPIIYNICHF